VAAMLKAVELRRSVEGNNRPERKDEEKIASKKLEI